MKHKRQITHALFEALVEQTDPRQAAAQVPPRDRRLCGLWITLQRARLGLNHESIAQRTGSDLTTLALLERGLATRKRLPDPIWEHLCFTLSDPDRNIDRIAGVVTLALGLRQIGSSIILQQVADDIAELGQEELVAAIYDDTPEHLHTDMPATLPTPPAALPADTIITLLRHSIFAGLQEAYLELLASHMRAEQFEANQIIFRQGSLGDALYIVAGGQVQIAIETQSGREIPVERPGPGTFFGELALLDGRPRSATVRATQPTQTLCLQRQVFEALGTDYPEMYRFIAAELARRLRNANAYVEFFSDNSPRKRLALALRYLATAHGQESEHVIHFDLAAAREDLIRIPGNSHESVEHDLAGLEELGVLTRAEHAACLSLRKLEQYLR